MTLPTSISTALAAELADSTPEKRAELVDDFARAVYDHVKFRAPEGEGLDGRDGPERQGLGDVVNASHEHAYQTRVRGRSA